MASFIETTILVIHIILSKLLALSPILLEGGQFIKPNNSHAKSAASTELTRKRSFDVLHIGWNEGGRDRSSNIYGQGFGTLQGAAETT